MDERGSTSSGGWVRTSGTKRRVEASEQKRSASEGTMSNIQEVLTAERSGGVDLWRCRCRRRVAASLLRMQCARTYVLSTLLGAGQEQGRGVRHGLVQEVFPPDRRRLEISRGVQGITFEVIRTFQRKTARARKLLGKAADAVVEKHGLRRSNKVREEVELLKSQEGIPDVSIDHIKKARLKTSFGGSLKSTERGKSRNSAIGGVLLVVCSTTGRRQTEY